MSATGEITTDIPARMDRLPWSRFHLLVVVALGITWVLDGLEVTIVGSIGPILKSPQTLGLTDQDIGSVAACYVAGAVVGALLFGWLTDRFGRRLIFNVTLGIYLLGVLLSAFSWNFWSFAAFRCITGLGIGGEYAAINSAIDELIPARLRGRIDLIVNGSYWGGAADRRGGLAAAAVAAVSSASISAGGWASASARVLGGCILLLRRFVPESPRWQVTHGREREAEETTADIEHQIGARSAAREGHVEDPPAQGVRLRPDPARHAGRQPRPQLPGARADGRAGVPVQRGVLHLRAGAGEVLSHRRRHGPAPTSCRWRRAISSARCCSAICSTRWAARR